MRDLTVPSGNSVTPAIWQLFICPPVLLLEWRELCTSVSLSVLLGVLNADGLKTFADGLRRLVNRKNAFACDLHSLSSR